jgi:hypothetical protein
VLLGVNAPFISIFVVIQVKASLILCFDQKASATREAPTSLDRLDRKTPPIPNNGSGAISVGLTRKAFNFIRNHKNRSPALRAQFQTAVKLHAKFISDESPTFKLRYRPIKRACRPTRDWERDVSEISEFASMIEFWSMEFLITHPGPMLT